MIGASFWGFRSMIRRNRAKLAFLKQLGMDARQETWSDALVWAETPGMPRRWKYSTAFLGTFAGREIELFLGSQPKRSGGVVLRVGVPPSWPHTVIGPEYWVDSIGRETDSRPNLSFGTPDFRRLFRVRSDNAHFASTLLSNDVQQRLIEHRKASRSFARRNTVWTFGHGALSVSRREQLDVEWVKVTLVAIEDLLTVIPPELNDWSPPTTGEY